MDVITGLGLRLITTVLAMMSAYKTAVLARSYKAIKTFSTSVAIGPSTNLGNLVESNYSGYAPIAVTALNGPNVDSANNAFITTNLAYFQRAVGPIGEQVFAAALVGTIAGQTAATGTAAETGGVIDTVTVTLAGGVYQAPPRVTVADPTGTGAKVTATIDINGAVDGLVIDDGGTGYTLPTLTIEPPVEILAGFNLTAPVPMTSPAAACPIVIQQNIPVGA